MELNSMQDNFNVNSSSTPTVAVATATVADNNVGGVYLTLIDAFPFLWVGLLLCITSVFFGIAKARAKNEPLTIKKCVDGFIGKVIKYSCWSLLGCSFAWAFQINWLKYVIIGAVYLIELDGIYDNYCESKGIKNKLNFSNLIDIFKKK